MVELSFYSQYICNYIWPLTEESNRRQRHITIYLRSIFSSQNSSVHSFVEVIEIHISPRRNWDIDKSLRVCKETSMKKIQHFWSSIHRLSTYFLFVEHGVSRFEWSYNMLLSGRSLITVHYVLWPTPSLRS